MTQAMEAQRLFETNSKMLQLFYNINHKSASEIAKI